MKKELIITNDGSNSIYMPEMDENYHSTHGAIQEAKHVFIANGLSRIKAKEISVFELGFGTGLNAFLSKCYSELNKVKISYDTIEAYPLAMDMIADLNYADQISESEQDFIKLHSLEWGKKHSLNDYFTFKKRHLKIQDYQLREKRYDMIFFDAFGPRAQVEMWQIDILTNMYNGLKTNGELITYCAQGQFKRNLKEIGFKVESVPGPPGKREMTIGIKV